jgi:serine O-acetyltransferase
MWEFADTLRSDVQAYKLTKRSSLWVIFYKILWAHFYRPAAAYVFWMRVNYILRSNFFETLLLYRFNVHIPFDVHIGPGLHIPNSDIIIAPHVRIGSNCAILNGVSIGNLHSRRRGIPTIGDNVFIGTGAKILGPVTVGDNVTIGALSLVNRDIPSNSVAYGIPPNFTIKPK